MAERPPPLDAIRQAKRMESLAQQVIAMSNTSGVDPTDVAEEILRISKRQRRQKMKTAGTEPSGDGHFRADSPGCGGDRAAGT